MRSRGTGKVLYGLKWELHATPSTVACCVYENYSRHFFLDYSLSLSNATGDSPSDSSRSSSASFVRISSGKSISASFQLFIIGHFYFISRVSPASTSIHLYSNGRLVQQLHFAHVLRVFIARFTGDFATTAPEQN